MPRLDCLDPFLAPLFGTLTSAVGPGSGQAAFSNSPANRPYSVTINPGENNEETFQEPVGGNFTYPFAFAHAAGEPVRFDVPNAFAHFGYFNPGTAPVTIAAGSSTNFFVPGNPNRGQPSVFLPGIFRRVFSVPFETRRDLIWVLGQPGDVNYVVARLDPADVCRDPGDLPSIRARTLTLSPNSSTPGLLLATASVSSQPGSALTATVAPLQGSPPVQFNNVRVDNGQVLGDAAVGGASPGDHYFQLTAAASTGASTSALLRVFVRNVCPLTVTPAALPQATAQAPYGPVTFGVSGGTPPYEIEFDTALPPGLALTRRTLAGVPTAAGAFPLPLVVRDAGGCAARADYTLQVAGPACAANVTPQIQAGLGGFRRNLATGRWSQTVTLRNQGPGALAGPVALVLDNLSANAALFNLSGLTACAAPLGRPFLVVPVGSDEVLSPGETATANLEFVNSQPAAAITYTPRVLAGGTLR